MDVEIGSNLVRNTNGILIVENKRQIQLGVREDGQALLTMSVYDTEGKQIAKLNNNAWAFNEGRRFDITTHPASLRLVDKTTEEVVVEVNVVSRTSLRVPQGHFFSHLGHEIFIAPDALRIMDVTMRSNFIEGGNAAIVIRPGHFGIGA